ncbi:MAG: beta-lactamase family protein, partial [Acidobacteriota bacterium]|nr:beta-lactamase family protein [Acidobacteriota bacterium]
ANKAKRIPFSKESVFNIASLTKPFTATAILLLTQQGILKTGDQIGKFFDNVPKDKASITVHHLLTHTSGLRFDVGGRKDKWNRDEVVKKIMESKPLSEPGEKFAYSNSGYLLLAAIVEKSSGQSYEEFLANNIFEPAGMRRTGFTQSWKPSRQVAFGFNDAGTMESFLSWSPAWSHGRGNIVSTLEDVHRWHVAIRKNSILHAKTSKRMFERHASVSNDRAYGYGWYITKTSNGETVVSHGGDNKGYHIELRWFPEKRRTIIVYTNKEMYDDSGFGLALHKRVIAGKIALILDGIETELPPNPQRRSERHLRRFIGDYAAQNGGRIRIWSDGGRLNVGADGQPAIDALLGASTAEREAHQEANAKTAEIIEAVGKRDKPTLERLLGKSDAEFFAEGWFEDWEKWEKEFGVIESFRVNGTFPLPWQSGLRRTLATLNFKDRSVDLHFTWNKKSLYETLSDMDFFPGFVLPLAPNSKSSFYAYNLVTQKSATLGFAFGNPPGPTSVSVRGANGPAISFVRK